ncbi:MAG: ABC transporter permease, partial [Candidatus Methanofastidiosia archaeon]
MRLSDLTKMVLRNLSRSKFRAFLTMMGVVIGTAAIIAMVSIGIGLQENITGQLESFGDVSLIWVFPGGAFGQGEEKKLEDEDILEFEKIEGVVATTPLMIIDAELQLRRGISKTSIYGIEPKKAEIIGQEVEKGRYLRRGDTLDMVAGAKVSETFREEKTKDPISKVDLFGKTLKITFE